MFVIQKEGERTDEDDEGLLITTIYIEKLLTMSRRRISAGGGAGVYLKIVRKRERNAGEK